MKLKNIIMILMAISLFATTAYAAIDSSLLTASLINQDPDPAVAGEVVELRIGIENKGGASADNLEIELVSEYPFEVIGEQVQTIGTIKAYQEGEDMQILKYKVKVDDDVSAGTYEIKIIIHQGDSSIEKLISVDVKSSDNAEVIHIDKTVLVPGKQTGLKFTINNVGNTPLRDLTFSFENEDKVILPVGSDNTKYVNYVGVGESAELEYQVIADSNAIPGLYELKLSLTYDNSLTSIAQTTVTSAGVYVGGGTDFDVVFSESTNGEVSFSISNIGSNPANSVSIIIPKQDGWKVSGSSSSIIGNLNKGDYTIASYALQSTTTPTESGTKSSGSNKVTVQIAYTDTMGNRLFIEKAVELNLQGTTVDGEVRVPGSGRGMAPPADESFLSKYGWYLTALILIAGFFWYKKHKKTNKK